MNRGGTHCSEPIQLDDKASLRPFRVDCPHQEIYAADISGTGDDGVLPW